MLITLDLSIVIKLDDGDITLSKSNITQLTVDATQASMELVGIVKQNYWINRVIVIYQNNKIVFQGFISQEPSVKNDFLISVSASAYFLKSKNILNVSKFYSLKLPIVIGTIKQCPAVNFKSFGYSKTSQNYFKNDEYLIVENATDFSNFGLCYINYKQYYLFTKISDTELKISCQDHIPSGSIVVDEGIWKYGFSAINYQYQHLNSDSTHYLEFIDFKALCFEQMPIAKHSTDQINHMIVNWDTAQFNPIVKYVIDPPQYHCEFLLLDGESDFAFEVDGTLDIVNQIELLLSSDIDLYFDSEIDLQIIEAVELSANVDFAFEIESIEPPIFDLSVDFDIYFDSEIAIDIVDLDQINIDIYFDGEIQIDMVDLDQINVDIYLDSEIDLQIVDAIDLSADVDFGIDIQTKSYNIDGTISDTGLWINPVTEIINGINFEPIIIPMVDSIQPLLLKTITHKTSTTAVLSNRYDEWVDVAINRTIEKQINNSIDPQWMIDTHYSTSAKFVTKKVFANGIIQRQLVDEYFYELNQWIAFNNGNKGIYYELTTYTRAEIENLRGPIESSWYEYGHLCVATKHESYIRAEDNEGIPLLLSLLADELIIYNAYYRNAVTYYDDSHAGATRIRVYNYTHRYDALKLKSTPQLVVTRNADTNQILDVKINKFELIFDSDTVNAINNNPLHLVNVTDMQSRHLFASTSAQGINKTNLNEIVNYKYHNDNDTNDEITLIMRDMVRKYISSNFTALINSINWKQIEDYYSGATGWPHPIKLYKNDRLYNRLSVGENMYVYGQGYVIDPDFIANQANNQIGAFIADIDDATIGYYPIVNFEFSLPDSSGKCEHETSNNTAVIAYDIRG